jgi:leukotriene-A4 hydrolase
VTSVHDIFSTAFDYEIKTPQKQLGDQLTIYFKAPLMKGQSIDVIFEYYSTSSQRSTSWLTPEQTQFGKFPFMFTQCEAIYCRSIVPIQDSPSVKFTYEL